MTALFIKIAFKNISYDKYTLLLLRKTEKMHLVHNTYKNVYIKVLYILSLALQ